jgi:Leucine-rich repeat (LRR) protein
MKNIQGGFIMKRKMLISIALITIMLLNCIMPLFVVNATEGEEIQLNSKLYTAVKTSLNEHGISFTSNDITHTITISSEAKQSVTELNLNENGIYDLTGLDAFSNLTHLELSGNNLSKDSNLEVLNNLPLNYLDLSTNQLEDVSSIDGLISKIKDNNGTVILSGQTVTIVEEAIIDEEENSDNAITATYSLPLILEKAGFIKSAWRTVSGVVEDGSLLYPTLESISNPVTADNNEISIRISSDGGYPYKGLFKLEIYIYDDPTEASSASNLNPAANNMLNGSRFYIYVVVHGSNDSAITTTDTNLYKAIKQQLTAGQTVNSEIDSYPYSVNAEGNIIYDECTYTTYASDKNYLLLTIVGGSKPTYALNTSTNTLYEIDYSDSVKDRTDYITVTVSGKAYKAYTYKTTYEKTVITTTSESGEIKLKEGYKVAHLGENRTLYVAAYDEAKTFVIDNTDLVNKITSLVLNNKEIRDLTGLEKFIGLNSYLNVSHNYLTNIDPIYELQTNKDAFEATLQEKYNYYLNTRTYGNLTESLNSTKSAKTNADSELKNISSAVDQIMEKFKAALDIKKETVTEETVTNTDGSKTVTTKTTPNENYDKEIEAVAKEIDSLVNSIYGYDQVDDTTGNKTHVYGYLENLTSDLNKATSNLDTTYSYLSVLYNIYNNEYKLTTLLTSDLNYQDLEEYLTYEDKLLGTADSVRELYTAAVSRIVTLDSNQALSTLEKKLIAAELGVSFDEDSENTIATFLSDTIPNTVGTRLTWVNAIEKLREIALYSEMNNYCLIKRMEEETATYQCYCEEYLEERIQNFSYEGIDTTLEETILEKIQEDVEIPSDKLYTIFREYMNSTYDYTDGSETIELATCDSEYTKVNNLIYDRTIYSNVAEIATKIGTTSTNENLVAVYNKLTNTRIIKTIALKETIDSDDDYAGDLNLYKEAVALAGKFVTNSSEVSRYVTLPKLRKLDISYNAYLEGIEKIDTLTGIRELYANADYITDISEVNWNNIKYLRKLGLAYNYIPNIKALEALENIVEIDASHNLIAGSFEFNFTKSQKTLKELDLSYNQIDDITSIMEYIDFKSNGNDGNYLAREDTININLNNQTINMKVNNEIDLNVYPETINVDLPKIFTQLKALDVERTEFGETSQNGRIESEGKYVTLNTRTAGDKEGVVEVVAMSGNGTAVDTCIGKGTKAIIKYTVTSKVVDDVNIDSENEISMKAGETKTFTAIVEGDDSIDKTVTWSIEGNASANTKISNDGVLTIGEDETAETIKVIATSKYDGKTKDTITVKLVKDSSDSEKDPTESEATTVTVTPSSLVSVKTGNTKEFKATVTGDVEDKTVTWSIEGNTSANTKISNDGVLTVAEDETAENIKVTATLNSDSTKKASVTVNVVKASQVVDIKLGYELQDEYLANVKAKTPVADFKKILIGNENYNVVIKKDGQTITSGYMGTGMYVQIQDENGEVVLNENGDLMAYGVIVKGDVNGDGYANSLDSLLIKAHRTEVQTLKAEAFEAADINNDGKVNAIDAKLLLYHRAEVKGYDLNYSK